MTAEKFQYASGFASCGVAHVQKMDGTHALINPLGEIVVAFAADYEIADFKEYTQVTTVHQNGKVALLDAHGEMLTPFHFEEIIISPESGLHPFLREGLWGYLDDYGNEAIPNTYLATREFTYNYPKELSAIVQISDPSDENEVSIICITPKNEVVNNSFVNAHLEYAERQFARITRYEQALALAELPYEKKEPERKLVIRDLTPEEEAEIDELTTEEEKLKAMFMRKRNYGVSYDVFDDVLDTYILHHITVEFKNKTKEEIIEFLGGDTKDQEIVEVEDNYARYLLYLHEEQEIDLVLYHQYGDYEIGVYSTYMIG